MTDPSPDFDSQYELADRYRRASGRVYLSGVQALVRLPMLQRERDRAAGLDTRGFVSGYRGSPLGTYDLALWQARELLEAHDVRFEPGVNEDLAATAVWGTQQAGLYPDPTCDGVFGIWYGKGPGVDRSCDALKHANYAGTAPQGGVLALAGDDPGAKSSSIAHQSEQALIHCGIPVLNPSSVQDYLDFGLYGWALSRYAGCWVGFKCLTDTVESAGSVEVGPERVRIALPSDFERPEGLHIGWTNLPAAVERRLYEARLPAAQAFVRANRLDRVDFDGGRNRLGIVTTGKTYLDVRQALDELGLDAARAREIGLEIYKVAMPWPLEPEGARAFARAKSDVIVIEEKRPVIEEQLARLLFNAPERPRLVGKIGADGAPCVSNTGELSPGDVVAVVRGWLEAVAPDAAAGLRAPAPAAAVGAPSGPLRLPAFCSGCPHNTSTVVPEGSVAQGGIGCHGMAVWLPDRPTLAVTHMGGEGANWIGSAPYTGTKHIFQNLGDGTYFHSGLLAIRAAVTAGVNITYKILANGAVAMTGGQPIEGERMEGEITVPEIARQLAAEGVERIAVVGPDPSVYGGPSKFPRGTTLHPRERLDRVQRELRETPGVSALIYDQVCAAEARRLRKRGEYPDPDRRVVINERVCEGCGDCSVQSNCISIEPVETAFGRKRRINQSSCNKDFSCLKGHCPSFATIEGGSLRRAVSPGVDADAARFAALPEPPAPSLEQPFNVLVTGIGGSGVVTVGALIGMAAHLEGKGVSVLDVTGLAQKNGPVTSHVRVAARPEDLAATRITAGGADLVLGCDIVVASGAENLARVGAGRTTAVVNSHVAPTFDFATNPDLDLSSDPMERALRAAAGDDACDFVAATRLATALCGDALFTNPFLMGFAYQRGKLPVGRAALERAFELNARAVETNRRAFAWGRLAAHDPAAVEAAARPAMRDAEPEADADLDAIVERRVAFLTDYHDAKYAAHYRALVERTAARESEVAPGSTRLARAVARYAFKMMAIKDEYEVARLYTDGAFQRQLDAEFEGEYRVYVHFAPPFRIPIVDGLTGRRDPDTGRMKKWRLSARWFLPLMRVLARFKFLRGTPLDLPGWTAHRRLERRLRREYEQQIDDLLAKLNAGSLDLAVEIASLPEGLRGFESVREQHLEAVEAKREELLAAYRLRA